jgi:hypothetical protein
MHAGQRQSILAAQWREGETRPTLWQGCLRVSPRCVAGYMRKLPVL